MPKFSLSRAAFESFINHAPQGRDHTASRVVGLVDKGIPAQGQRVERWYFHICRVRAKPSFSGYSIVLQNSLNKLMHALHGNTVIRLNWEGEQLWAKRVVSLSEHLTFEDQPTPLTYSTKEILRYRTSIQSLVSAREFTPNIKTTPLADVQSDKTNH